MDLGQGYNLGEEQLRQLVLLEWIATASLESTLVELRPVFDEAPDHDGEMVLLAELRHFDRMGWIRLHEHMAPSHSSCELTVAGRSLASRIQQHRHDSVGRVRALRDAILRWLHEEKLNGNPSPVWSMMKATAYGTYYGKPFSDQELDQAAGWLKDRGYIGGVMAAGAAGPVRPTITVKGEDVVESGVSVTEAAQHAPGDGTPAQVSHITVGAGASNISILSQSPSATLTVSITQEHRQAMVAVADCLEQALAGLALEEDQRGSVEDAVAVVRDEAASSTPRVGRVRAACGRALEAVATTTAQGLGAGISAYIQSKLGELPLG